MRWATRRMLAALLTSSTLVTCGGDEYYLYTVGPVPGHRSQENHAPVITLLFVGPLETDVGYSMTLGGAATDADGDVITLRWSTRTGRGSIGDATAADTTFTCERAGADTITLVVSDGKTQRSESVAVRCG